MPPAWLIVRYLNRSLTLPVNSPIQMRAPAGRAPGDLMNFLDLLRAVFGLAFTLGLIGLAAWAVRRYAPQLMARLQAQKGERRLQVVETLVLDPARRLVLVRVDDEERLILLGEGRELIEPRQTGGAK